MHDCLSFFLQDWPATPYSFPCPHLIGSRGGSRSVGKCPCCACGVIWKCTALFCPLTDRLKHFLHQGPGAQSGFSSSSCNLLLFCSLFLSSFLILFFLNINYYKWADEISAGAGIWDFSSWLRKPRQYGRWKKKKKGLTFALWAYKWVLNLSAPSPRWQHNPVVCVVYIIGPYIQTNNTSF